MLWYRFPVLLSALLLPLADAGIDTYDYIVVGSGPAGSVIARYVIVICAHDAFIFLYHQADEVSVTSKRHSLHLLKYEPYCLFTK